MMHESVEKLVDEATEYLHKVGYRERTIAHHRSLWLKFVHYVRQRGRQQPFLVLARNFLTLWPSTNGSYWDLNRKLQHSMRILMEFSTTGQHRIKTACGLPSLPVHFDRAMDSAILFAEKECGWAKSTLVARRTWMRHFIRYLIDHRGIQKWKDIVPADLPAYLDSLQIGRGSRVTIFAHIRVMFRILFTQGVLSTQLHNLLPPFNRFCRTKLSTIWSPAETSAFVASVDRSTALGKRDYAVLFPDISPEARFFLDEDGSIVDGNCYWITATDPDDVFILKLILGVANSSTMARYHELCFQNKLYAHRRRYLTQYVQQYPLPSVNCSEAADIVRLVGRLTTLPVEEKGHLQAELDAVVASAFGVDVPQLTGTPG